MRPLLFLPVCILFSGCTRIAFIEPVGKPVPASETSKIKGEWLGQKGSLWRVEQDPGSNHLVAKWQDEGKEQNNTLVFTTVGKDNNVYIVWAYDKELVAYLPLRISPGADEMEHVDSLALLYPSEDEVKRLVGAGKLSGAFNKDKNAWLISKGDWDSLLERADFWRIDLCMPFVRNKGADKPAPADVPPDAKQSTHP